MNNIQDYFEDSEFDEDDESLESDTGLNTENESSFELSDSPEEILNELMPPSEIQEQQESPQENADGIINAQELIELNLPPAVWIVNDILPAGLTILTSRPKVGKSAVALNLAVSVATGIPFLGKFTTIQSPVLFISNEDSKRLIKKRITAISSRLDIPVKSSLPNLLIKDEFPKLNLEGKKILCKLISQTGAKLIIIDTFGKAIDYPTTNKNAYFVEYEMMSFFHHLAQVNEICLFFVHHSRKQASAYHVDSVLGTSGISGAADTIWTMHKTGKSRHLEIVGKEIEETEVGLSFDKATFTWSVADNFSEYNLSPEQDEIYKLLLTSGSELELKWISEVVGKNRNNVNLILKKLIEKRLITKVKTGVYKATVTDNIESTESVESDESVES